MKNGNSDKEDLEVSMSKEEKEDLKTDYLMVVLTEQIIWRTNQKNMPTCHNAFKAMDQSVKFMKRSDLYFINHTLMYLVLYISVITFWTVLEFRGKVHYNLKVPITSTKQSDNQPNFTYVHSSFTNNALRYLVLHISVIPFWTVLEFRGKVN